MSEGEIAKFQKKRILWVLASKKQHRTKSRVACSTRHDQYNSNQTCHVGLKRRFAFGCAYQVWDAGGFPARDCWFDFEMNEILLLRIPKDSRAGIPSIRKLASREMSSTSVELCETDVCFLHIQLLVNERVTPENAHKSPPEVDFGSSKSPAKSES